MSFQRVSFTIFTTNIGHYFKIESTQPDICALVPTGVGELCPDIDDILLCSFTIGSGTKTEIYDLIHDNQVALKLPLQNIIGIN